MAVKTTSNGQYGFWFPRDVSSKTGTGPYGRAENRSNKERPLTTTNCARYYDVTNKDLQHVSTMSQRNNSAVSATVASDVLPLF